MKVIHQKHYPTLQVDSNENDIVQIAQNGKEDFNLIMVEKERARDFALLVCPELAEEIEIMKEQIAEMTAEIIELREETDHLH
jgi:hypothetical protein